MSDTQPVVVHLVHGTWPYGPLRRIPHGARKSWFENGSSVRQKIFARIGCPIEVVAFPWSGRNSFAARAEAARSFAAHLRNSLLAYPNARHVVLAHSHGGTVAAHALSMLPHDQLLARKQVAALVCLATPFAYSKTGTETDRTLHSVAVASVVVASLALLLASYWSGFREVNGALLSLIGIGAGILLSAVFRFGASEAPEEYYSGQPVSRHVRTFIMRETRDEAALAIGLTQVVRAATSYLFRLHDDVPRFRRPQTLFVQAAIVAASLAAALTLVAAVIGQQSASVLTKLQYLGVLVVVTPAMTGLLYLVGYSLVAIATGFSAFRSWPSTIVEVDAVPPEVECSFKAYSSMDSDDGESLRHGLYDRPEVQDDVAKILEAVAEGRDPYLV